MIVIKTVATEIKAKVNFSGVTVIPVIL